MLFGNCTTTLPAGTVSRTDEPLPNHGYYVARPDGIVARTVTYQTIYTLVEKLAPDANYYGVWSDKGLVYVDASDLFEDKDTAVKAAKERKQIAIWDIASNREILTGADDD